MRPTSTSLVLVAVLGAVVLGLPQPMAAAEGHSVDVTAESLGPEDSRVQVRLVVREDRPDGAAVTLLRILQRGETANLDAFSLGTRRAAAQRSRPPLLIRGVISVDATGQTVEYELRAAWGVIPVTAKGVARVAGN